MILPVSEVQLKTLLVKRRDDDEALYYEDVSTENYDWKLADKQNGIISNSGMFKSKERAGDAEVVVVDKKFRTNEESMRIRVSDPYLVQLEIADVTQEYVGLGQKIDKSGFGTTSF